VVADKQKRWERRVLTREEDRVRKQGSGHGNILDEKGIEGVSQPRNPGSFKGKGGVCRNIGAARRKKGGETQEREKRHKRYVGKRSKKVQRVMDIGGGFTPGGLKKRWETQRG